MNRQRSGTVLSEGCVFSSELVEKRIILVSACLGVHRGKVKDKFSDP